MTKKSAVSLLALLTFVGCGPDAILVDEDRRIEDSAQLIEALSSPEPGRGTRATIAMGRIQSTTYTKPLLRGAQLSNPTELQVAAIFALGQLAITEGPRLTRSVYAAFENNLGEPEIDVVVAALEAMGKLGEPSIAHRIYPYLEHDSDRVRAEAALALFRSRFIPLWRDELETAPPLPEPAVQALIAATGDESDEVRRAAVYAFSRYGQPAAIGALTERLADSDEWVRLFAARGLGNSFDSDIDDDALGTSPSTGTIAALTARLEDSSPRVRTEAIVVLSALGRPDLLSAASLGDSSFSVRAAAARAHASGESAASLAALRELERDGSVTVRATAIESLAVRLGPDYLDEAGRRLDSTEWPIRVAAVRAAGNIGDVARPLIDRALGDSDPRVRAAALEALGALGAGDSPAVRDALGSADEGVRGTAVDVFGSSAAPDMADLFRAVYENSPGLRWVEIRAAIVDALRDDDAARVLTWNAARHDPQRAVRDRAIASFRHRTNHLPRAMTEPPQASPFLGQGFASDPVVVLATTKGEIEIRVLASEAPVHAASFIDLVEREFYDGLIWHRVVPNFVIQGGDPLGNGWGGPGYLLRDEINRVRYDRGMVGMPKAGRDTGGCQIFITHVPTPHLDGLYTVFGEVISGMDVVDEIEVGDRIVTARLR